MEDNAGGNPLVLILMLECLQGNSYVLSLSYNYDDVDGCCLHWDTGKIESIH